MFTRTASLLSLLFLLTGAACAAADDDGLDQLLEQLLEQELGWLGPEAAMSSALRSPQRQPGEARAMADLEQGASLLYGGRPAQARRILRDVMRDLQGPEPASERTLLAALLLARACETEGRDRAALDAYARARSVTHRRWGSHNLVQRPLVYRQARILAETGETRQAEELLRFAWRLSEDHRGVASPSAVADALRVGRFLRAQGDYRGALSHYRSAMKRVSRADGEDSPLLVPLLRGRALAYLGGPLRGRSIGDTRRAADLMDRHPGVFDLDERIRARLEYGDLLMVFSYERRAVEAYEAAWALAAAAEGASRWLEELARPRLVRYRTFFPAAEEHQVDAQLRFDFDLSWDGRPRRVELVDSSTDGAVNYYAPWIFTSEARFRPAIVDGEAVPSSGQQLTLAMGRMAQHAPVVRQLFPPQAPAPPRPQAAPGYSTN